MKRIKIFIFTLVVMMGLVVTSMGLGKVKAASFLVADGYQEGLYATWGYVDGATHYDAYVKKSSESEYTPIDDMLIRQYQGYMRVDAMALEGGISYDLKVEALNSSSTVVETFETTVTNVIKHLREGYGWVNGTSSGAHNENGTIKANTVIVYVTNSNKDSVTATIGGTTYTGITNILAASVIKNMTTPLLVRMIGNITDFTGGGAGFDKGDLLIDNGGNTVGLTIEGVGNDATANGWGIRLKNSSNVEISNLGTMNCDSSEGDNIGLQQANDHIWVHNCDMFYGDAGSDADQVKGDGALDTKKSEYVTHSFNHFWDSGKCNLQGGTTSDTSNYITYHHNWYDHSDSRHPRVRVASVHVYNNYYDGNSKYGVGATCNSDIFVENNYFRNCKYPMMISGIGTDALGSGTFSGEPAGMIKAYGNTIVGATSFIPYNATSASTQFDAYVASSRNETVPSSVSAGGVTYNNFDTASNFYDYNVETAEAAKTTCETYAGRYTGSDFTWDFDDATEDTNYDVITGLKSALVSYSSSIKYVGGTVNQNSTEDSTTGGESGGETGGETGGSGTTSGNIADRDNVIDYVEFNSGTTVSSGSTAYSGPGFEVVLVGGGATITSNSATASDGTTFTAALLPGGSGRSYTVNAIQSGTFTFYFTVTDGKFASKTATISYNGTSTTVTSTKGTCYAITFDVVAGESYDITCSANRFAAYGAVLVSNETGGGEDPGVETYTLTFVSTQGTAPSAVSGITSVPTLEELSASGYIFGGWFYDSACTAGNEVEAGDPLTANTTIYAKWTEETTGGEEVSGTNSYTSSNYAGLLIGSSAFSLESLSEVSSWPSSIKNKTLLFPVPEGSEGTIEIKCGSEQKARYAYLIDSTGAQTSVKLVMSKTVQSASFTNDNLIYYNGQYYVGVSTTDDFKGTEYTITYTVSGGGEDPGLETYTLTFVSTYGTAPSAISGITSVPTLEELSASGYTFGGWFYDEAFTEEVTTGDALTANTTIYAKWTKDPVELSVPEVQVSYQGFASWAAVENATAYAYSINGAAEVQTTATSVELVDGDTIQVRAIGDGSEYLDSELSAIKTYYGLLYQFNNDNTKLRFIGVIKTDDLSNIARVDVVLTLGSKTATLNCGSVVYKKVLNNGVEMLAAQDGVYYAVVILTGLDNPTFSGADLTAQFVITYMDDTTYEYVERGITLPTVEATYTVTYSTTYGSASSVSGVTALPNPLPTLEYEGYTFGGWYLDSSFTQVATAGSSISADTTLYAKWTENPVTYTLTFVSTQGTAPSAVSGITSVPTLETLSASGYAFGGWFYDAACTAGNEVEAGDALTANTTIYAKWTEESSSTETKIYELYSDNGTIVNTDSFYTHSLAAKYYSYDSTTVYYVELPEDGTITFTTSSNNAELYFEYNVYNNSNKPVSYTITNNSDYSETVTGTGNNRKTTPSTLSLVLGSAGTYTLTNNEYNTMVILLRVTDVISSGGSTPEEDPSVDTYTLTFVSTQGTAPSAISGITSVPTLEELSASGYTFGGWFYDEAFTEEVTTGDALTANTTIYAKWTEESSSESATYTITFADSTPVGDTDFFTVSGNYSSGTALKLESSSGSVKFTAGGDCTLVITQTKGSSVEINGTEYAVSSGDTTIELAAGTYEITKGDGSTLISKVVVTVGEVIPPTYTITYVTEVGTAPEQVTEVTALPAELPVLTYEGYTFVGWYLTSNFSEAATAGAEISANTTLYAKWINDALMNAIEAAKTELAAYEAAIVANLDATDDAIYISQLAEVEVEGIANIEASTSTTQVDTALANAKAEMDAIEAKATMTVSDAIAAAQAELTAYANDYISIYNDDQLTTSINTAKEAGLTNIAAQTTNAAVEQALLDAKANIDAAVIAYENQSDNEIVQQGQIELTSYYGAEESAEVEFNTLNTASDYSVYIQGQDYSTYTKLDEDVLYVSSPTSSSRRANFVGLKAGKYSIRVVPVISGSENIAAGTTCRVTVSEYDRSGYAHYNYTSGVGAYNDDGTLKDNAIVLYVTDDNKNTVSITHNGVTVTGIGNILNSAGKDTGSGTTNKGGTPNTNQDILKLLANDNIPLVVRFVGTVSNSGLYEQGTFAASSTPLINGLTYYDELTNGGSVGDNGHMARMQSGKDITIEGVGERATIDGWGFHFICQTGDKDTGRGTSFEVRNLVFINTPEDAVGMEGTQGILSSSGTVSGASSTTSDILGSVERCWVHDNEFYCPSISSPAESDKSEGDGSVDFKRGQYMTCSYNYFEGCHKTNLVGSSDSSLQFNLTYHHNYWKECGARGPLARNANIHMYNNIYEGQNDYCQNPRANAFIFSEYNMFYKCKNPSTVASGGVVKSYNDSFASYINDLNATIVSSKSTAVSNSCQFSYRGIDYSRFELDSSLSYIPTNDYELHTDFTELRKDVVSKAGALGRVSFTLENITEEDYSIFTALGVKSFVEVNADFSAAPGKISKTIYAFTVSSDFTITADFASGVLVNAAGEALATGSANGLVLKAGTYAIQPINFGNSAFAYTDFKEITIGSIVIEIN